MTTHPSSMHRFVLGATGRTGRAILPQAQARRHAVSAFVGAPGKLTSLRDDVTVVKAAARRAS